MSVNNIAGGKKGKPYRNTHLSASLRAVLLKVANELILNEVAALDYMSKGGIKHFHVKCFAHSEREDSTLCDVDFLNLGQDNYVCFNYAGRSYSVEVVDFGSSLVATGRVQSTYKKRDQ